MVSGAIVLEMCDLRNRLGSSNPPCRQSKVAVSVVLLRKNPGDLVKMEIRREQGHRRARNP